METGFGSPTYPQATNAGFGSPYTPSLRDTGFGSPYDQVVSTSSLSHAIVPNHGGTRLHIYADWKTLASTTRYPLSVGGFKVSFIDDQGMTQAISHGGFPQSQGNCYTDVWQTMVVCYVPPLAKGTYSILVEWGNFQSLRLDDSLVVVDRFRASSVYSMRKQIPPSLSTGARDSRIDPISKDTYDFGVLESILLTVGEQIHTLVGQPTTILASDFDDLEDQILHVESTIGFPDQGSLFVENRLFTYTSKTNTTFLNLQFTKLASSILRGGVVSYVISDI